MKSRKTAIKTDPFAANLHHQKLDQLDDPLLRIGSCIDFTALAAQVDGAAPRPVSPQGGPTYTKNLRYSASYEPATLAPEKTRTHWR